MKTVGLIDHHDSFCDNLARYFKLLGVTIDFRQSDDLNSLLEIPQRGPTSVWDRALALPLRYHIRFE